MCEFGIYFFWNKNTSNDSLLNHIKDIKEHVF